MGKSLKVQRVIDQIDEDKRWRHKWIVEEPVRDYPLHWQGKDFVIRANRAYHTLNFIHFVVKFDPRTHEDDREVALFFLDKDIYWITPIDESLIYESWEFAKAPLCVAKCGAYPHKASVLEE